MTVRELIEDIIYLNPDYLDKELAYYKSEKDNIIIEINSIGISDNHILLAEKCPHCQNS